MFCPDLCALCICSGEANAIAADVWHNLSVCLFARGRIKEAVSGLRMAHKWRVSQLGDLTRMYRLLQKDKLIVCVLELDTTVTS